MIVTGAEVASLWYIAGSLKRLGWCLCLPLVAFDIPSGALNLVIAAAIAAALRGDPRAAVVMGAAKLSPLLAIDLRQWRPVVITGFVLVAVSLPWAGLWFDWVRQLVGTFGLAIGDPAARIDIPFIPRLLVAIALWATGRRWARGIAAIIATPALWWASGVMLLGLVPRIGDPGAARTLRFRPSWPPPGELG